MENKAIASYYIASHVPHFYMHGVVNADQDVLLLLNRYSLNDEMAYRNHLFLINGV